MGDNGDAAPQRWHCVRYGKDITAGAAAGSVLCILIHRGC